MRRDSQNLAQRPENEILKMSDSENWASLGHNKLFNRLFFNEELISTSERIRKPLDSTQEKTPSPYSGKVMVLLAEEPSESQKTLLSKIFMACGLTDNQTATLIGLHSLDSIRQFVEARLILSFGALQEIEASHLLHQEQLNYIPCLSLGQLELDASAKKLLWNSLKSALSL
jgi:hypothetical protein